MNKVEPRFSKSKYEELVVITACNFLRHATSGEGYILDRKKVEQLDWMDVQDVLQTSVPYKYPLTVRKHSGVRMNPYIEEETGDKPAEAHVILANYSFCEDVVREVQDMAEDENELIQYVPQGEVDKVDTERVPQLPNEEKYVQVADT